MRVALEVRVPAGIPAPATLHNVEPAWLAGGRSEGVLVGGAVLDRVGLALPVLAPGHALVVVLEAEGAAGGAPAEPVRNLASGAGERI